MPIITLKAQKEYNSQFAIGLGIMNIDSDGKYDARIALVDRKKPKARHFASDIHITSSNKQTVYEQIQQLGKLFPPMEKDVNVLDLSEEEARHE